MFLNLRSLVGTYSLFFCSGLVQYLGEPVELILWIMAHWLLVGSLKNKAGEFSVNMETCMQKEENIF